MNSLPGWAVPGLWWRFALILVFCLLPCAEHLQAQACGVLHDETKFQRGREYTVAFVPEGTYHDVFACLMTKANQAWQAACPNSQTSAKLRLRTQDRTLTQPVTVYRMADTLWNESTINFNNASLAVQWSAPVPVPLAADTWHEIDVTGAITGNGIYTLGLATVADQGNLDFWSRESIYPPMLEITFQP